MRYVLLTLMVLVLAGCSIETQGSVPAPDYAALEVTTETPRVEVEVYPGASLGEIGAILVESDVVASERAFKRAASDVPDATLVQAGKYRLPQRLSAAQAIEALRGRGEAASDRVVVSAGQTLPEVLERVQMATDLDGAELEAAAGNPPALGVAAESLEGWLAPGGYDLPVDATPNEALAVMVRRQQQVLEEAGVQKGDEERILTLASVVQAEGVQEDFGKVARVIANRNAAKMPLQMDSTLNYLSEDRTLRLTNEDLEKDSPYNTYQNLGLPPTPIGAPSPEAITAALAPPAGDWVYFVLADKSGRSFFTSSYEEFLAAKRKAKEEGVY